MKNPQISIIIPDSRDGLYINRCLNALDSQTFHDFEIIRTDEDRIPEFWKRVDAAIDMAAGEYIFFCSVSSVLGRNVLEHLYKSAEKGKCEICQIMVKDGNGYAFLQESVFSIYGKLYEKSFICDNKMNLKGRGLWEVVDFNIQYFAHCEKVRLGRETYLYETQKDAIFAECNDQVPIRYINEILSLYKFLFMSHLKIKSSAFKRSYFSPSFIKIQESEAKVEDLHGWELSQNVIKQFESGKLGFKTIIMAIWAWIRFKL